MTEATDFDKKMLLMATRLAHESDLKHLLLSVLQELFKSVEADDGLRNETEAITLIRCMIRLTLRLIADPGTGNRYVASRVPPVFYPAPSLTNPFVDAATHSLTA